MTKRSPFRYFRTSPEVIRLAVMMYVRFPLSLRNVEAAPDAVISKYTPKVPINPCGRSMLMVEKMFQDILTAYGLRLVGMRYFNVAGDDCERETGVGHCEETYLIPLAILAGLGRIDDFRIFGNDYDTRDGSAVQEYIDVTELAQSHAAACGCLLEGCNTDQFNVGMRRGYSVIEIVEAVARHLGQSVPHRVEPHTAGDPQSVIADPSKIRQRLGFGGRHSDLGVVIQTADAWHQRNRSPANQTIWRK